VKTAIAAMNLKPGDELPSEMKLAQRFNVGRSTIREAFKVLTYLGLLDRKGRKTIVAKNPFDLDEDFVLTGVALYRDNENAVNMIEVLFCLEGQICRLAAERSVEEDFRSLEECLHKMEKSKGDIEKFIEADVDFHMALARATKNSILLRMSESTRDFRRDTMRIMIKHRPAILEKSLDYHENIFKAVSDNKYDKAERTMNEHLKDVESEFRSILQQNILR